MPRKGVNVSFRSYDDIFETDESRADSQLEKVQKIPINGNCCIGGAAFFYVVRVLIRSPRYRRHA